MVLILSFAALLFLACAEPDFSNPYDENGKHFIGRGDSSSSTATALSSSENQSTVEQSSSSIASSSSTTTAPSYSSSIVDSSSIAAPSSSSITSSSSTTAPSSSSVASSSSGNGTIVRGEFTDDRDGTVYKWVEIGEQTWMAENLNYETEGGLCYGEGRPTQVVIPGGEFEADRTVEVTLSEEEFQANCATYGRLYSWATAMGFEESCNTSSCASQINIPHKGICPSGWHIPNAVDWGTLNKVVGGTGDYYARGAGKVLKTTDGWNNGYQGSSGNGTDAYGFAALPSGYRSPIYYGVQGSFCYVGETGFWWSTSEISTEAANLRQMNYNSEYAEWTYYFKSSLQGVRCVKD